MTAASDRAMPDELTGLLDQIDEATARLVATVAAFTDADLRQPSLLAGWSRGHVLTHLARGGEALRNLLDGARTGEPVRAYASPQARAAAIEDGAGRAAAVILDDVTGSAAVFRAAALAVPETAWGSPVRVLDYQDLPAAEVVLRRLCELELHHVDLDAGYRGADWPARFVALELPEPMRSWRDDRLRWSQDV